MVNPNLLQSASQTNDPSNDSSLGFDPVMNLTEVSKSLVEAFGNHNSYKVIPKNPKLCNGLGSQATAVIGGCKAETITMLPDLAKDNVSRLLILYYLKDAYSLDIVPFPEEDYEQLWEPAVGKPLKWDEGRLITQDFAKIFRKVREHVRDNGAEAIPKHIPFYRLNPHLKKVEPTAVVAEVDYDNIINDDFFDDVDKIDHAYINFSSSTSEDSQSKGKAASTISKSGSSLGGSVGGVSVRGSSPGSSTGESSAAESVGGMPLTGSLPQ